VSVCVCWWESALCPPFGAIPGAGTPRHGLKEKSTKPPCSSALPHIKAQYFCYSPEHASPSRHRLLRSPSSFVYFIRTPPLCLHIFRLSVHLFPPTPLFESESIELAPFQGFLSEPYLTYLGPGRAQLAALLLFAPPSCC